MAESRATLSDLLRSDDQPNEKLKITLITIVQRQYIRIAECYLMLGQQYPKELVVVVILRIAW